MRRANREAMEEVERNRGLLENMEADFKVRNSSNACFTYICLDMCTNHGA